MWGVGGSFVKQLGKKPRQGQTRNCTTSAVSETAEIGNLDDFLLNSVGVCYCRGFFPYSLQAHRPSRIPLPPFLCRTLTTLPNSTNKIPLYKITIDCWYSFTNGSLNLFVMIVSYRLDANMSCVSIRDPVSLSVSVCVSFVTSGTFEWAFR